MMVKEFMLSGAGKFLCISSKEDTPILLCCGLWEIIETPQFSSYKYVVLFLCGVDRFPKIQRVRLIYDACSFS